MRNLLSRVRIPKKLRLLAAAALVTAAGASAPHPAQAACHNWTEYYTYYSDASKTTEVGWCQYECYCITYCEGQKTVYYNHWLWPGCL
jgi:hypothetical protein